MVIKFIWQHCTSVVHALTSPSTPLKILSEIKPISPRWKLNQLWSENSEFSNKEIGDIGEDLATEFVKNQDYKVLYRNFDPQKGGEIDLVCRNKNTLVFIEVKTRINALYRPLLAVDKKKQSYLKKGAFQYLSMLDEKPNYRFDVVEVFLEPNEYPTCNLVKNIKV